MASTVPATTNPFGGRGVEAKQRVWSALGRQLPADHTVYALARRRHAQAPDFAILTPSGLAFMVVATRVGEVCSAPYTGHALAGSAPGRAAKAVGQHILSVLPSCFRHTPKGLGHGLLQFSAHSATTLPGLDLRSTERRVLVANDLPHLADWVGRALADHPAEPALSPEMLNELNLALSSMAIRPSPHRRRAVPWRRLLAAGIGAVGLVLAAALSFYLDGDRDESADLMDMRPSFSLPGFIPRIAEEKVMTALDEAWENPQTEVIWREGELAGTVQQSDDTTGRPCHTFRITRDLGEVVSVDERRYCRPSKAP